MSRSHIRLWFSAVFKKVLTRKKVSKSRKHPRLDYEKRPKTLYFLQFFADASTPRRKILTSALGWSERSKRRFVVKDSRISSATRY